jgi:hypothetical protein
MSRRLIMAWGLACLLLVGCGSSGAVGAETSSGDTSDADTPVDLSGDADTPVDLSGDGDATVDVPPEPALVLGVNEVLVKHPSAFTALEDGDQLEIELGGFNGLWMLVLAFRTRGYFPERVIVFADITVNGEELSSLSLSKQSLVPGDDGWDYYYDFFLIANDTSVGGEEAIVDLTVRDYENQDFEVSIQRKLLIVGGEPAYWP